MAVKWSNAERDAAENVMRRYGFNVVAAFIIGQILAALAPFVAAREAKAWDEGVRTALDHARRNPDGITLRLDDQPNPYRIGGESS